MELPIFEKILSELAAMRYSNALFFGRYHEPLADPIILERIERARRRLPDAFLSMNTNGDYLNREYLRSLEFAGLDELKVMHYQPNGSSYSTAEAERQCTRTASRLRVELELLHLVPNEEVSYRGAFGQALQLSLHAENYNVTGLGCDRGGTITTLSRLRRERPCIAPRHEVNIDFDGSLMPCCNMLSDIPSHTPYILGNIADDTLIDLFYGSKATSIKDAVASPSPSLPPCRYCQYYWPNRLKPSERKHVDP
jgi:radical SAM protein with 4Fe4S-binding SPASM domain